MSTANVDTVRDGSKVKQDRALYRGSGEIESNEKGIKGGDAKTTKNRIRMDPARALEPSKKKLTSIEAQRIMNVFVDTINRAKLVSMIPYITQNLDQFEPHFDEELLTLFKQHIIIQNCYLEIKEEMVSRLEKRERKFSKGSQETLCNDDDESTELESRVEYDKDVSIDDETEARSSVRSSVEPDSRLSDTANSSTFSERQPANPVRECVMSDQESVSTSQEKDEDNEEEQKCEEEEDEEYKAATQMLMRNLSLVAEQLSNSCKNILRAFTKYPSAITAVNKEFSHMSSAAAMFINYMEEMKGILRCRLLTSPLEEKDQAEYLKELNHKTQQNELQIQKLEAELAEAIAVKEEEVSVFYFCFLKHFLKSYLFECN